MAEPPSDARQLQQRITELEDQLVKTQARLQAAEQATQTGSWDRDRLQTTLSALPDLMFEVDEDGRIVNFHAHSLSALYVPPKQFLGKMVAELLPQHAADAFMAGVAKAAQHGLAIDVVYSLDYPDGDRWFDATMASTPEHSDGGRHVIALVRDVTVRHQTADELRKQAHVQELLIDEINHRVRNNLMSILSMLSIERRRATSEARSALDVIADLAERIRSVATAHDVLSEYEWRDVPISILCERVVRATIAGRSVVQTKVNATASTVSVSAKDAHHLALVVAELTTNTIKHGASSDAIVQIDISVQECDDHVVVWLRDRGPGYPNAILSGVRAEGHLGLQLVENIVGHSLEGKLVLSNDGGAVAAIHITR